MSFQYKRSYCGPVRGVIFDWAGTTVDYGCFAPTVVFIEIFKRFGVEISVAEARAPMGVAVIGGMMTSTLLTLLVIPCVYTVMDDMIAAVGRVFGLASPAGPHGAEKQTEVQ